MGKINFPFEGSLANSLIPPITCALNHFPIAAGRNRSLNQRLLSESAAASKPSQKGVTGVNSTQQQLYDSVQPSSSHDYYSTVPSDGSFTTDSAHYSEVSFGEGTTRNPPAPSAKMNHSHLQVRTGMQATNKLTASSASRNIDQSQQIYANVSVEAEVSTRRGVNGFDQSQARGVYEFDDTQGRGVYEFDENQARSSYEFLDNLDVETSQAPLVVPQAHLYSYACVGTPEVRV